MLAGVSISPTHLQRLGERVGGERAAARDADVRAYRDGTLPRDYERAPAGAAVMLDGGRYQTRAEGAGRGAHAPSWRETKMTGVTFAADPQPRPAAKFLYREQVKWLVG